MIRVFVDRGVVESNVRTGTHRPPILVDISGVVTSCFGVTWGGGRVIYDPRTNPSVCVELTVMGVTLMAEPDRGQPCHRQCPACNTEYEGDDWTPCPNTNCPSRNGR